LKALLVAALLAAAPALAQERLIEPSAPDSARATAITVLKHLAEGDLEQAAALSNAPAQRLELLRGYRDVVPEMARTGVTNFFNNLRDLWSSVNALLQGDLEKSGQDWMRFSVNTVLGFGGVVDWASPMGLDPHYEDLGQTFGVWGMEPGAYLVLPFLGSSTARDTLALPADFYAYPDQWVSPDEAAYGLLAWRVVNTRANLLDAGQLLSDISLDKYTFVRDGYLQRRRSLVFDGDAPETPEPPEAPASAGSAPSPAASSPEAPASAASAAP